MFIQKYWLPLSVFVVAVVSVGLYLLATQPPPEPIKIYKAVEPLATPTQAPTTQTPVGEKTEQGGHWHADGTWHAEPHVVSDTQGRRAVVAPDKEHAETSLLTGPQKTTADEPSAQSKLQYLEDRKVESLPPPRSAKAFLMEKFGYSEAEIERKKPYIKAVNRLAWEKPENWTGRPFEVGSTYEIWTIEDENLWRGALGLPLLPPESPVQKQAPGSPNLSPAPQTIQDDIQ